MITCRTRMNFRLSKELDSIGVLSGSLGFLNPGCSSFANRRVRNLTNLVKLLCICSFSSGGEDGYVRVHFFDADYYHIKV